MKIYVIQAKDKGQKIFDYMPELTASEVAARRRKQQLEQNDYYVTIDEYEVKTQGVNFNTIARESKRI